MDTKTISKQAKKAVAIGLCASLVGGVAAPVLNTSHVAYAAVASKPSPNSTHSSIIQLKDQALKERILWQMYQQRLISSYTQDITEADALKVKSLNLYPEDIKQDQIQSIEGIENFKNLTRLDCTNNQISDLTPLAGLSNLTQLNLSNNKISDLTPLTRLPNLTTLNLYGNQISDLTLLASLNNLIDLYLGYNQISDLKPLASLNNLIGLDLDNNQISDLTPLAGLSNLTQLSLDNNQISDLKPLASLFLLTQLSLDNNQISDLKPLTRLPRLARFRACNNHIKNGENIGGFLTVTTDYFAPNQTIFLQPTTPIVDLKKEIKGFGDVTFNPDENIVNGVLTYKDGMKSPYQVKVSDHNALPKYSATVNIDFSNAKNPIIQFNDENLKSAILADMKKQHLIDQSAVDITEDDALKVGRLDLFGKLITSIEGLEKFKNLTELWLTDNNISNIEPLSSLPNLTNLSLYRNHISDLSPLAGLSKLASLNAQDQTITLHPKSSKVELAKEIKGAGKVVFGSDENIVNGALTHKDGMQNPYVMRAKDGENYSATINIDFSNAPKSSETQTGDISEKLQALLNEYDAVKGTDNYKNADDKLKQAYDKAIKDGQKIYDKLSSTPAQVKQVAETIKTALEALNGDKKAQATIQSLQQQLNTATGNVQKLTSELEKAKQQGTADASTIATLTGKVSDLTQQLEKLKSDKTLSEQQKQAKIDELNGKIAELGKQITQLTQENTTLKGQVASLQEQLGKLQGQLQSAQQQGVADKATIERLTGQVASLSSQLDALKADKTKSDQEKQKEIERLTAQLRDLTSQVNILTKDKNSLQQQLDAATGKVSTLTSELEQLKAAKKQADEKNEQTIAALNSQITQLGKDKQGLQEQINTKQAEISKLQGQIQALRDDHSKSDTEKQKKIEQLTTQLATLTQEKQGLQGKLDAANEKISTLTHQLQQAQSRADADTKQIQELTNALQQAKKQLEQLKSDKTKSDEQKQQEIDTLNAKIAELEKKVQTCRGQAVGGAIVAPLVNEKPTFDIEKYKREHNYMLPGIATHTYQTKQDTFTSDVHAALQQLAPMAASTNAAVQATAQRTDESERAQAEQKADTSSKHEADKTILDQNKFPQTGDNSLIALVGTFAGALVLVLGCFARKKSSKANKR